MPKPLKRLHPDMPLYHWSLAKNRDEIEDYGLKLRMASPRGETRNLDGTLWFAPYLCFGTTPADALYWANLPPGFYDLWQVDRDPKDDLKSRRDGGPYIIEVRIRNNIAPERLMRVGSRKVI